MLILLCFLLKEQGKRTDACSFVQATVLAFDCDRNDKTHNLVGLIVLAFDCLPTPQECVYILYMCLCLCFLFLKGKLVKCDVH